MHGAGDAACVSLACHLKRKKQALMSVHIRTRTQEAGGSLPRQSHIGSQPVYICSFCMHASCISQRLETGTGPISLRSSSQLYGML